MLSEHPMGFFACWGFLLRAIFDEKANHHLNTAKFHFFVVDEKCVHATHQKSYQANGYKHMIVNTGLNRIKSGILQRLPDFLLPILTADAAKSGCKV